MLKERELNKSIYTTNDELLIEILKGYIYNKVYEEDERKELGDEEEDDENDEWEELGDDEDDEFEEEDSEDEIVEEDDED